MLDEARKREKVANAFLAATLAASAAQSPRDFVRTGHIEAPGTALMQIFGRKRGEAERNLDSARVSEPARNRKKKTFKEFVEEAYLIEGRRFVPKHEAQVKFDKMSPEEREAYNIEEQEQMGVAAADGGLIRQGFADGPDVKKLIDD